jgi:predicted phage tail protein
VAEDVIAPTAPTTFSVTALSDHETLVTWSGATDDFGVTNYVIERCVGAGCTDFTEITSVSAAPLTDGGLVSSTPYRYRMYAYDGAGHSSPYTSVVDVVTLADGQAPSAPMLDVAGMSGTQVHLVWTGATDNMTVAYYQIERCQGAGCTDFTLVGTSRKPGFWSTGLSVSSAYTFRVRALDLESNSSAYSNVKSATTTMGGEDCD